VKYKRRRRQIHTAGLEFADITISRLSCPKISECIFCDKAGMHFVSANKDKQ
jgi:hypothetical protein